VDEVLAGLGDEGADGRVVARERAWPDREDDGLAGSGGQVAGLGEVGELQRGLFQRSLWFRDVGLHHLTPGDLAGVQHRDGDLDRLARGIEGRERLGSDVERRVGQPVPEGIGGLDTEGGEVAVADVQALLVHRVDPHVNIGGIARPAAGAVVEVLARGDVGICLRPRVGQASGGVDGAVEDPQQRESGQHAANARQDQRVHVVARDE
jgi:hypothetical protein